MIPLARACAYHAYQILGSRAPEFRVINRRKRSNGHPVLRNAGKIRQALILYIVPHVLHESCGSSCFQPERPPSVLNRYTGLRSLASLHLPEDQRCQYHSTSPPLSPTAPMAPWLLVKARNPAELDFPIWSRTDPTLLGFPDSLSQYGFQATASPGMQR